MTDKAAEQLVRQLADLRLQVNALEVTAKSGSLPETVNQARRTVRWSAVIVALALIVSTLVRTCNEDHQVQRLEQRIDALERAMKKL